MPALHDRVHEVRDPLYGFVKLSEAEWDIVNCPEFQRLRDIRQLAMGHMVYPGANHTRFEHSIGCLHLSTLMFDALVERDADILEREFKLPRDGLSRALQVLRLAALLHDVGHAPFSHSGEELLPWRVDGGGQPALDDDETPVRVTHEEMSAAVIRESTIRQAIDKRFRAAYGEVVDEVVAVGTGFEFVPELKRLPHHEFLNELLTGEFGSDRIDYLLRDAYHSGQKSGEFDYRRLVGSIAMVPPPKEAEQEHRIGFDEGGWLVAEQMVVARYLMYQSLYFHKTKRIYEIHLEQFMKEWAKTQWGDEGTLPRTVQDYVEVSDSRVLQALYQAAVDSTCPGHEPARRFIDRSHMRLAKELILLDNLDPNKKDGRYPCKNRFDKLKDDVSIKFGSEALTDEPDHSATRMFTEANKIWVILDGHTRYLDAISEIVRGMSSKIWRGRVYAEPGRRGEVKGWCNQWIADNPLSDFDLSTGGSSNGQGRT